MKEFKNDFKEQFYSLCRFHELKPTSKTVKETIRSLDEVLHTEKTQPRDFGIDYSLEDPDYKDLCKLQQNMVKECIDFINSHPKLLKILETKRNELSEEWNKNYTGKHLLTPETQVYFGISGIEESLINNKWVPSTDSFLDIGVGPISILGVR